MEMDTTQYLNLLSAKHLESMYDIYKKIEVGLYSYDYPMDEGRILDEQLFIRKDLIEEFTELCISEEQPYNKVDEVLKLFSPEEEDEFRNIVFGMMIKPAKR